MSTQPLASLETPNQSLLTTDATLRLRSEEGPEHKEEHRAEENLQDLKFVVDEPWKIKILPEEPKLPPGVLPGPEHAARSLPWKMGDVARLKDDSPEGMMRYIATHSTGWWKEMAQRALRDTERAEREAAAAGVQYGQLWTLEVDVEAKEKLRAQEEARQAREQAERAREEAAKEAFAQRQTELLKKAGKAPRCEYLYTDGAGCKAPQVRGERWCHGHARMMSYRPEKPEMVAMEDENAVMLNLLRVQQGLLSGRITEKLGGLMLWSIAIGAPGVVRVRKPGERGEPTEKQLLRCAQDFACGLKTLAKRLNLPRMNADGRGSGLKGIREKRMSTNEKDTLGGIEVLHSRQRRPLLPDDELKRADCPARGFHNSGVTRRKSFKSGVEGGVPGAKSRDSHSRENSLKQHRHYGHSRDLSTPPHSSSQAQGSSESLKVTAGGERVPASGDRKSSPSPRMNADGRGFKGKQSGNGTWQSAKAKPKSYGTHR
jgi:hypothetical protein